MESLSDRGVPGKYKKEIKLLFHRIKNRSFIINSKQFQQINNIFFLVLVLSRRYVFLLCFFDGYSYSIFHNQFILYSVFYFKKFVSFVFFLVFFSWVVYILMTSFVIHYLGLFGIGQWWRVLWGFVFACGASGFYCFDYECNWWTLNFPRFLFKVPAQIKYKYWVKTSPDSSSDLIIHKL
jgi:hypothetical protein